MYKRAKKIPSEVHKRISTTLAPEEFIRAKNSRQTYRNLICLGLAHLDQAPKIIEERRETNQKIDRLKAALDAFRRDYYTMKQDALNRAAEKGP